MTESQHQENPSTSGSSIKARLLIVLFMGAVVVFECLFAYFWLPSAEEVAAQVELVARQNQAALDKGEKQQEEEIVKTEVDLGDFTITNHRLTEGTFRTDFHLWGTVAEKDEEKFKRLFERNKIRFRNQVIQQIRESDISDLEAPGLGLIKRRILEKSNALLGEPLLRSVLFADYTFVEI